MTPGTEDSRSERESGPWFWNMATQMALIYTAIVVVLGILLLFAIQHITRELSVRRLSGELKRVVATSALLIDGDTHRGFRESSDSDEPAWQETRAWLERTRRVNDLEFDHIYTFNIDPYDPGKLTFAVMLHEQPFAGDIYRVPDENRVLIQRTLDSGQPQMTGIYTDENGTWISAFQVICDSDGAPAGLLQADHRVEADSTFSVALASDMRSIRLIFLLFVPVVFVIIYTVTRTIALPIETMAKLSEQSIEKPTEVPMPEMRWNELHSLASAFNRMRARISHQIEEMRHFNRELERRVTQKTHRLEEANQRLRQAREDLEKQASARIEYEKTHDVLTGLTNRTGFSNELTLALADAQLRQYMVGVIIIGIDRFRKVNESVGTEEGDRILVQLSEVLAGSLKSGDGIARLDSDRFAVVLPEISRQEVAAKVANRLLDRIAQPIRAGSLEIHLGASIGIAIYPDDDVTASALIKCAETAMFNAKVSGGAQYRFYTLSMDEESGRRLALENGMRGALANSEFRLYYQPQVDLASGRIIGVEALIRWLKPDMGMVSPAEFIPLAEETGLIVPLGKWVIRRACLDCREWHRAGLPSLVVAVNLSGRQFSQADLLDFIRSVLEETGITASSLELEITESVAMEDVQATVKVLADLKRMGLNLAIDDFGTGYSSLSYLKQFALDKLKIDRSFVSHAHRDCEDAAIAKAVINLGHSLGLKVIAEGIETDEHLAFLRQHRCDEGQGYYFSKPLPESELRELLRKQI